MLVLSKKRLHCVAVGGPNGCGLMLNVTVVELQGGSVRLGLEVNTDVRAYRREVSDGMLASGRPGYPAGPAMGQGGAP